MTPAQNYVRSRCRTVSGGEYIQVRAPNGELWTTPTEGRPNRAMDTLADALARDYPHLRYSH